LSVRTLLAVVEEEEEIRSMYFAPPEPYVPMMILNCREVMLGSEMTGNDTVLEASLE